MDDTKDARIPQNQLLILRIGRRPLEWIVPKIEGTPPCARINPSMNYFENLNVIIIHGGRNDAKEVYGGTQYTTERVTFRDMFVLDLVNFIWIGVSALEEPYGDPLAERSEHSSCVYTNKMIIFGGIDQSFFVRSDLFEVNLGNLNFNS